MTTPTDEVTTIPEMVAALRSRIPQTRLGAGRELIVEMRDGLEDAAEAYRSAGLPPSAAERRAVQDFGVDELDSIAWQCRAELGASATLRAAIVVGLGYVLILGSWALYYRIFGSVTRFTNGMAAGNGFTIIGAISVLSALLTIGLLRFRRRGSRRIHPVSAAFVALSLGAVLATYLLALLSHREPRPDLGVPAGAVVQWLSAVITAVMTLTVLYSAWRTANAWHPERVRSETERNT